MPGHVLRRHNKFINRREVSDEHTFVLHIKTNDITNRHFTFDYLSLSILDIVINCIDRVAIEILTSTTDV